MTNKYIKGAFNTTSNCNFSEACMYGILYEITQDLVPTSEKGNSNQRISVVQLGSFSTQSGVLGSNLVQGRNDSACFLSSNASVYLTVNRYLGVS